MSFVGKYPYDRADITLQRLRDGKKPLERDWWLAIEALEHVIELRKKSRDKSRAYAAKMKQELAALPPSTLEKRHRWHRQYE